MPWERPKKWQNDKKKKKKKNKQRLSLVSEYHEHIKVPLCLGLKWVLGVFTSGSPSPPVVLNPGFTMEAFMELLKDVDAWNSLVAQWVKELALSLLWCGFDLWPRNFCMPQAWPKEKRKKKC